MTSILRNSILLPEAAAAVDPGADPEIKKLAERVDTIMGTLKEQLNSFEAAGSLEVSGIPGSVLVASAQSMYYQTFEDDVTDTWELVSGSKAAVTFPNNGKAGGRALRTTNKAVWLASDVNIPFDPDRLYRIRTRVRDISGTDRTAYVGVMGVGADGLTIVARDGTTSKTTQNHVCLAGTVSLTDWTTFTGYFKGVDTAGDAATPSTTAETPRVLHEDTRYFRPYLALSQGGDDHTVEIDYIAIEVLTETPEIDDLVQNIGGRDVDTVAATVKSSGDINDNKVAGTAVKTGAIGGGGDGGKNHIIAGSIVAANIKALTINAGLLTSLTGSGLTLDFHAGTGPTDEVISHSAFKLYGDGSADFSGEVSASTFSASSATFNSDAVANSQVKLQAGGILFGTGSKYGQVSWSEGPSPAFQSAMVIRAYDSGAGELITLDAEDIVVSGNLEVTGNIGFFSATPVSKDSVSDMASLTDVSGTGDDTQINTNFGILHAKLNELLDALQSYNLV